MSEVAKEKADSFESFIQLIRFLITFYTCTVPAALYLNQFNLHLDFSVIWTVHFNLLMKCLNANSRFLPFLQMDRYSYYTQILGLAFIPTITDSGGEWMDVLHLAHIRGASGALSCSSSNEKQMLPKEKLKTKNRKTFLFVESQYLFPRGNYGFITFMSFKFSLGGNFFG